jgi:hypothetical protein
MKPKHCMDPDCFVRSEPQLEATTTMELFDELRGLVDCCLLHGACYFIIDANRSHRYVQGLLDRKGVFTIEAVSNESLGEVCAAEHPIIDTDHATLIRLGWLPPTEDNPNWHRSIDWEWHYPSPLIAELLVRTLVEVHRATPDELELTVEHAHRPMNRTAVATGEAA